MTVLPIYPSLSILPYLTFPIRPPRTLPGSHDLEAMSRKGLRRVGWQEMRALIYPVAR